MKPTLRELATKYGCDKLYAHSYIDFYETLFAGRDVKRLLEIGIGYQGLMEPFVPFYIHGASLRMWREYWPEVGLFACDIRPEVLINEELTWSMQCDQSKPSDLWKLIEWSGGEFCVVIDDGSHETTHQIISAAVLLPHVVKGGVYIIEDVREPEKVADAIGGEIHRFDKRADDCLIVVRR